MDANKQQRITEAAKKYHASRTSYVSAKSEVPATDHAAEESQVVKQSLAYAQMAEDKVVLDKECGQPSASTSAPTLAPASNVVVKSKPNYVNIAAIVGV
jgi:hypothetical protein